MTTYARIGRAVTAAVIATSGAALVIRWLSGRRPVPVPVVRCPIHGIAYDAELELCPECAKTPAASGQTGREAHHSETTGGPR